MLNGMLRHWLGGKYFFSMPHFIAPALNLMPRLQVPGTRDCNIAGKIKFLKEMLILICGVPKAYSLQFCHNKFVLIEAGKYALLGIIWGLLGIIWGQTRFWIVALIWLESRIRLEVDKPGLFSK